MTTMNVPEINLKDIATIAALLRDEGDLILNNNCKLSLTVDFLVNLNDAFNLIVDSVESSCFQVINTNNSSLEIFHDLQFLHDFIQKVFGLRIWSKVPCVGTINFDKFRSLRSLELYAVNLADFDFSSVKDRLIYFACTRSNLLDLKLPFEGGSEKSCISEDNLEEWINLEEIFLSYNHIISIGSLCLLPNLKVLDLSHNDLSDISALENSGSNLEWLNISFNRLIKIPCLSCCKTLKVLSVNDNRLENLKGIGSFCSLVNLDASRNLLCDHSSLSDIMYLQNLENIYLEGNPISFKRGHRLLTIAFINPFALANHSIFLDKVAITLIEKSHFPHIRPFNLKYNESIMEIQSGSSSTNVRRLTTASTSNYTLEKRIDFTTGSKAPKIREAPIAEGECSNVNKSFTVETEESERIGLSLPKRDVEYLNKDFFIDTILSDDILGINIESPEISSSNLEVFEDTVIISNEEEEIHKEEVVEAREEFSEERGVELGVFVAQRKGFEKELIMDDILLVLTDKLLVERDGTSGKMVTRWHLNDLKGVFKEKETQSGTWIILTFKSRFDSLEKPVYFMDNEEAKELQRILEEILDAIQSDAINSAKLFTCIRCSTNFPESVSTRRTSKGDQAFSPSCPNCGSTIIVHEVVSNSKQCLQGDDVLSQIGKDRKNSINYSPELQFGSIFTNWTEIPASDKTNFEATLHGLQLYIMLNILSDGQESEFQLHEVLVYILTAEEPFHGYIVLSKDRIYILKDSEGEVRRVSLDGTTNPELVDSHPLTKCDSIIINNSSVTLEFESKLSIWVFPQDIMKLQNDLAHHCPSQLFKDESKIREASSSEVLLKLPLVSFQFENESLNRGPNLKLGMLILTSTSLSVMNFKAFEPTYVTQDSSFTLLISDLVGLKSSENPFLHQPGAVLHFSGESDDRQLALWPWGKGKLLQFIETLRKPWESLFSIPLETIAS